MSDEPLPPPKSPLSDIPAKFTQEVDIPKFGKSEGALLEAYNVELSRLTLIGYARSDIIGNAKLVFGTINQRNEQEDFSEKLKTELWNDGIRKSHENYAIQISIRRSHILYAEQLPTIPNPTFDKNPQLFLTADGEEALDKGELIAFGGQHRRASRELLRTYCRNVLKQFADPKTLSGSDKEKYDQAVSRLADSDEWLIALYDMGNLITFI
jgi:hypothetical protein